MLRLRQRILLLLRMLLRAPCRTFGLSQDVALSCSSDLFVSCAPSAQKNPPPSLRLQRLLKLLRRSWLLLRLLVLLRSLRLLLLLSLLRPRPLLPLRIITIIVPWLTLFLGAEVLCLFAPSHVHSCLPREKCGLTPRYLIKGIVAQLSLA